MSWAFIIYLASVLDGLKAVLILAALVCTALAIVWAMCAKMDANALPKGCKMTIIGAAICGTLATFVPDQKATMTMFGASITQSVVSSKDMNEIGSLTVDAIKHKLQEMKGE